MSSENDIAWDLPNPFTYEIVVVADDIDSYGHTNNSVYLKWVDRIVWEHSKAVGASEHEHSRLRRGMAALKTELHYVASTFEGDRLVGANWIVKADGRVRAWRRYQIVRPNDGATVLRALCMYACIDLDTGRPTRMPPEYRERYVVLPSVTEALARSASPFAIG